MGNWWTLREDRVPGDFSWDPLDMYPTDPAEQLDPAKAPLQRDSPFAIRQSVKSKTCALLQPNQLRSIHSR